MSPTRAYLAALAALLSSVACEDEGLRQLHPALSLCPAADPDESPCDRGAHIGDVPLEVPFAFSVYAVNVGDAPLGLGRVRSGGEILEVISVPDEVAVGDVAAIELSLTAAALGDGENLIEVDSDDPERPTVVFPLSFHGVSPILEVCDAASGACANDLEIDLGVVRRTRGAAGKVRVQNPGTAPLEILEVSEEPGSSVDGELTLIGSTRAGLVPVGGSVELFYRYAPADAVADTLRLVIASNDPRTPQATVTIRGTSEENLPPHAVASEAASGSGAVVVVVGEAVLVDGSSSSDPEEDPLTFSWTLLAPDGSAAIIDDPAAPAQLLSTDVPGSYRLELVVEDSLGQQSEPALVEVVARPRYGLRVSLEWEGAGDLDLHLVAGGDPFGSEDCYFGQPVVALGDASSDLDDAVLLSDAESAPGREDVVIEVPAAGVYGVYVHAYGGLGAQPASARVQVTWDEASTPILSASEDLDEVCGLWHVADVTVPDGSAALVSSLSEMCP